MIWNYFFS